MRKLLLLFILLTYPFILLSQNHRIIESTSDHIKIEIDFEGAYQISEDIVDGKKFHSVIGETINVRMPGEPWLPDYRINIGIPRNSVPQLKILNNIKETIPNKYILPTPDSLNQPFDLLPYNYDIYNTNKYFPEFPALIGDDYVMRYARVISLSIAPYQFNSITRELIFNKRIIIQVDFKTDSRDYRILSAIDDKMTDNFLKSTVINYSIAKEFVAKVTSLDDSPLMTETYWYNPQKDYYKIYLNKKGVYRITYDNLVSLGVPPAGLQNNRLEIFNEGVSIPIDVVDVNQDGVFNSGDYFQFVGGPPKPADEYTRMNIYNNTNVYWFSYQADTTNYYKYIDGFPVSFATPAITNSVHTLTWERDLVYQQFGHARNNKRDYWMWGYAEARNRTPFKDFIFETYDSIAFHRVPTKPDVKIRVGMHGLTDISCQSGNGHSATIRFNGKPLGVKNWNGQESAVFEKDFFIAAYTFGGGDTAQIFADKQRIEVNLFGNICPGATSDFIWINYIEFDYWRWNRTYPNYFYFTSPPDNFQENRYYLFNWGRDNMKIYIPERGELIPNPDIRNDADKSVYFVDTITKRTDYYCVANDYYLTPDSIVHHLNNSDLRNPANGADYIIITHKKFKSAAERLADFRSNNLPGYSNPRIKIVDIDDIYVEFSNGLLNPFALKEFSKYAFENWTSPAPYFIVLIGDMSSDYRSIHAFSDENYIPSIPFHGEEFGLLPSDNLIVSITPGDNYPDLSIGRLACQTIEEANNLVDKIMNYPEDNSKEWKENTILLASGLSHEDQLQFRFNYFSKLLEAGQLLPNGIRTTKVFNYPENAEDSVFIGSGPRMREEINKGAAVVSYYGHGGGAQWDLIFTKDDIPELTNSGRLPFISSITCYTAHFDNAESFGEIFVKIPNKGAIGFWGSVSVTWWTSGHYMNYELFNQIFTQRNYVIGSAILNTVSSGISADMIPQIVYLGDPAIELIIPKNPDFVVKSSDISVSPQNPLKDDTVSVIVTIKNLGVTFPGDSVTVELFNNVPDTANLIGKVKVPSFGEQATVVFPWQPHEAGLHQLIVHVNQSDIIEEEDISDNTAITSVSVFDFGEPNIVKPANGLFTNDNKIDFVLSDIGFYFGRNFNYLIQINSSNDFNGQLVMQSPVLIPIDGVVKWQSSELQEGEYFWRAVIYDMVDTNISSTRIFSITNEDGSGYLSKNQHLQLFNMTNVNYVDSIKSLILNTQLKPPHPEDKFFIDSIKFSLPPDLTQPSTFTTDGSYFYFGHLHVWTNQSKIYKIGTGLNGTVAGENYGAIPDLAVYIYSSLMHHSGYLYTCTGSLKHLLRIDKDSGDTTNIQLSDSLLLTRGTTTQIGGVYLYSDGNYVYNLAVGTAQYPNKFILRTFDPSNGWVKVGNDIIFNGNIIPRVSSFIVINGYLIVYENYNQRYLRRFRLSDGVYEEEWRYSPKQLNYYSITYDHTNDIVYFSRFIPGLTITYQPGFFKYRGTYIEAHGNITSQEIGPASNWHNLSFEIDQTNSNGKFKAYLLGKNKTSGSWETLDTLTEPSVSLESVKANSYNYIMLSFDLVDSSYGAGQPMKFNSLKVNFDYLPEVSLIPQDMTFAPDSMLQGIDVNMNLKVHNYGYIPVENLRLDFYLNDGDSVFFTKYVSVQPDSFTTIDHTIKTDTIVFFNKLKTIATSPIGEYFTFNNLIVDSFYVARDSVRPAFNITFDGKEILDGDIISSKPVVVITMRDDTPLEWKQSDFTIVFDNNPLHFAPDTLEFELVSPYPNAEARVTWRPFIKDDGLHTLEVLAKDPSGNFFDSTSYRISFYVYNQSDLRDVYNYPNPFGDNTYFTFELRGTSVPDELKINIYTIAGRMIRELKIPASRLRLGFNSIYWDGRDHDGDEIANGLYFYKVIYQHEDVTKTVTQKLAKVK